MEPAMSLSIEETIAELDNCDKPLLNSRLTQLSNLNSEELEFLGQVWAVIEPKRRRQIIYRLVVLAEDNFELDFDNIFISCLKDQAAGACGELGEEEAVPYLAELINDPDTDVQPAVTQTLGKIGGSEAKECLEQCLNNPSEVICQAAEQTLYELEAEEDPFSFRG